VRITGFQVMPPRYPARFWFLPLVVTLPVAVRSTLDVLDSRLRCAAYPGLPTARLRLHCTWFPRHVWFSAYSSLCYHGCPAGCTLFRAPHTRFGWFGSRTLRFLWFTPHGSHIPQHAAGWLRYTLRFTRFRLFVRWLPLRMPRPVADAFTGSVHNGWFYRRRGFTTFSCWLHRGSGFPTFRLCVTRFAAYTRLRCCYHTVGAGYRLRRLLCVYGLRFTRACTTLVLRFIFARLYGFAQFPVVPIGSGSRVHSSSRGWFPPQVRFPVVILPHGFILYRLPVTRRLPDSWHSSQFGYGCTRVTFGFCVLIPGSYRFTTRSAAVVSYCSFTPPPIPVFGWFGLHRLTFTFTRPVGSGLVGWFPPFTAPAPRSPRTAHRLLHTGYTTFTLRWFFTPPTHFCYTPRCPHCCLVAAARFWLRLRWFGSVPCYAPRPVCVPVGYVAAPARLRTRIAFDC